MSGPGREKEQSMDDILASIRKIISNDSDMAGPARGGSVDHSPQDSVQAPHPFFDESPARSMEDLAGRPVPHAGPDGISDSDDLAEFLEPLVTTGQDPRYSSVRTDSFGDAGRVTAGQERELAGDGTAGGELWSFNGDGKEPSVGGQPEVENNKDRQQSLSGLAFPGKMTAGQPAKTAALTALLNEAQRGVGQANDGATEIARIPDAASLPTEGGLAQPQPQPKPQPQPQPEAASRGPSALDRMMAELPRQGEARVTVGIGQSGFDEALLAPPTEVVAEATPEPLRAKDQVRVKGGDDPLASHRLGPVGAVTEPSFGAKPPFSGVSGDNEAEGASAAVESVPKVVAPVVGAPGALDAESDDNVTAAEPAPPTAGAGGSIAAGPAAGDAKTVEDLVLQALRPMLREWLDDNLPKLVEKQIVAERLRIAAAAARKE